MDRDSIFIDVDEKIHFLIKRLQSMINIIPATLKDYPTILNMARFYVYDLSRECGFISKEWALPPDGLYESFDFKNYFEDPSRKAFLIKVNNELAGFVLLNKAVTLPLTEWNMGEFFILAKFQGKGIGQQVAHQIWEMHPGLWEVSIIPENKSALAFWRKAILTFTSGKYTEEIKTIDYDKDQPKRFIISFDATWHDQGPPICSVRQAVVSDVPAMVSLSHDKRRCYEKAQPQFWRHADNAEEIQTEWFKELLQKDNYIILVAKSQGVVMGFIIGSLVQAPEVYNPGGLTLMVDDFCVASALLWNSIGKQLITELKSIAASKGASQILVVCGAHDEAKQQLLKKINLAVASAWYVGSIIE